MNIPRISTNEESHFWYKANREFSIDLLENHCHLSGTNHILDAGLWCRGTTVALKNMAMLPVLTYIL